MAKKNKKETNLAEIGVEELQRMSSKNREELFKLRFRSATVPLKNTMQIRGLRREIAKIETFINQQRRAKG